MGRNRKRELYEDAQGEVEVNPREVMAMELAKRYVGRHSGRLLSVAGEYRDLLKQAERLQKEFN